MATPEEYAQQPPEQPPHLVVIPGGLAVREEVAVAPVPYSEKPGSLEELMATLNPDQWDHMNFEQISAERQQVLDCMGDLALRIHELTEQHTKVLELARWLAGYVNDRRPSQ